MPSLHLSVLSCSEILLSWSFTIPCKKLVNFFKFISEFSFGIQVVLKSACPVKSNRKAIFKPDALKVDLSLDYVGLVIPNDFIVGFGLDYDRRGRNFKDIYTLVQE